MTENNKIDYFYSIGKNSKTVEKSISTDTCTYISMYYNDSELTNDLKNYMYIYISFFMTFKH